MNQKHLKNIFQVNADAILVVENVIQNRNGILISASVNVKSQ